MAKCPYCDFNSHVVAGIDQPRWRDALVTALRRASEGMENRPLASVFFGGGTPSLMAPETVGALLDEIARLYSLDDRLEVTLEANPTSSEAERFAGFRAAGVNRVSIGVQALDDAALRFLGRKHSSAEALGAVALASRIFPRMSFDLIYARPDQTEAAWDDELARALDFGPEHLSLYQLTYEEGTPFGAAHARGILPALDDERAATLYERTQRRCEAAGLPAYEISNHARRGAECRHNLVYWRYGEYLGLGPGAHGRLGGVATVSHRTPQAWLAAIDAGGDGIAEHSALTRAEQAREYLLMSLRLAEGTNLARYETLGGTPLDAAGIQDLCDAGMLIHTQTVIPERDDGGFIRATPQGRLVLNRVIAELAG